MLHQDKMNNLRSNYPASNFYYFHDCGHTIMLDKPRELVNILNMRKVNIKIGMNILEP